MRKNTVPKAPTTITASPSTYNTENITLSWSGASGGTSAIKGYMIASRTSTNNSTWGAWDVLITMNLAASSGTYTPTVSRVTGTYTQFGIWTIDKLDVYSLENISNSILCAVTACVAPTSFALSATLSEGGVTLSWSGAAGGAGNAIIGYEIESSESADNAAWGACESVGLVGSSVASGTLPVAPSGVRGNYKRFRIRVQGAAGSAYYSPWKTTTNTVRKNVLTTPPTTFSASPPIYATSTITLNWSGTIAGISTIKNYVIQQSTSTNNTTWSTWEAVTTIVTSATSGTFTATPSAISGMFTRYRIAVTDTLNAVSSYVISNVIKKNTSPPALTIAAPKDSSSTYDPTPRYLIQVGVEADGEPQTIHVFSTSGTWLNTVDNPEHFCHGGTFTDNERTIFRDNITSPGTYTVRFEAHDEYSASTVVSRTITVLPNPFEEIIENVRHVKAEHILTIRTAVNVVRNYYGMTAFSWGSSVVSGVTKVRDWVFHIVEIRRALDPVITLVNSFHSESMTFDVEDFEWISLTGGRPKASVVRQIYEVILGVQGVFC